MVRLTRRPKKKSKKGQKSILSLKERLAKKRKAKETRKKIITLAVTCLLIGLTIGIPLTFLVSIKAGISVALLIPSLIVSYYYPRQALWFFLIYMPFGGTVTYGIGGGNALFQLSKDVFYLPALLALIQECRRKRKPIIVSKEILLTLSIIFILALTTLFLVNGAQELLPYCDNLSDYDRFLRAPDGTLLLNPETGIVYRTPCKGGSPFLQGVLGFKVLLGYVPLIFCGYYLIEDKKQLIFLGRVLLVLAIVCCSLGLIQYLMLSSGYCAGTRGAGGKDLFRASLEARCFVGGSLLYSPSQGQIRLPGTFVSPWHWAWFLIANSFITYTVAFSDTSFFWRTGGLIGLALVFINAVISGQRLALALVPFAVFVLLILTGQIANLKRFIPATVILGLILVVVITANPAIVQERVDSFISRWNSSPPHLFVQEQFRFAMDNHQGILGRGLGKATNSARTFGDTALVETFHPKLIFEIGYIGLLAFMALVTNLTFTTFKSYRLVKIPSIRSFGSSFWVFILIISYFPYWYPLDTDPVAVYYWFFAGVLLRLPEIDKEERKRLKLEEENLLEENNPKKRRKRRRRHSSWQF